VLIFFLTIVTNDSKPVFRWVILSLTWMIYVSFGLITSTLAVIVSQVMVDLGLSYSQMGFTLGSWPLVYTFVAIPFGFLTDRIGPYKSLFLATCVISFSAILRLFAINFETLTILVGLFGIGGSLVSIGIPKVTSMWFVGKERGTASGIYTTGFPIGSIIAFSLTNSVVIPLVGNWRNAYLLYGLFGFLVTGVWLVFGRMTSPYSTNHLKSNSDKSQSFSNFSEIFRSRNVWLVVVIGITSFLTGLGISNWLPKILEVKEMAISEVGLASSFLNIMRILGTIMIPRLPYVLGSRKLSICLLLFFQGISIFSSGVVGLPGIWFILGVYGLTSGLMPLLMVILMDLPEVGPSRMGMVAGLFFAIGELGGFAGPFAVGLLKDLTGTFLSGLIFLSAFCFTVLIPAVLLKVDEQ